VGRYTVLQESPGFKIKRIEVKPGAALSLQLHHRRSEHWVVVAGIAEVTRGEDTFAVNANGSTYIPVETKHRLANPGSEPLVMIEVQCGDYLGEDDIVRFDDKYGRVPAISQSSQAGLGPNRNFVRSATRPDQELSAVANRGAARAHRGSRRVRAPRRRQLLHSDRHATGARTFRRWASPHHRGSRQSARRRPAGRS
jgi:mannose-6-phosphate isomerase-like protein (cupin superfamily)